MSRSASGVTRRRFLKRILKRVKSTAAGVAVASIVPRNVLGQGQTPPSEQFGGALVGCGGRGGATFKGMGPGVRLLAQCDVKFVGRTDNKNFYTDYRRVMQRKDIDVVAIATHPGWHALVSFPEAIRTGRTIRYDPVAEQILGDEEANRLAGQPMRAPWRI